MSAKFLLVSEVTPEVGNTAEVARQWASTGHPADVAQRAVYESVDQTSVLELVALRDLESATALTEWWNECRDRIGHQLRSDFSRQLLTFVEAPKNTQDLLPATTYIQMRHVEVRPPAHRDYLAWRDRTIFDVVRQAKEVDVFLAYHSAIRTEPGVMFVSGFSCAVDDYTKVFNSERYQEIVRQAGTNYITGGERGLYTKIYRRVLAA